MKLFEPQPVLVRSASESTDRALEVSPVKSDKKSIAGTLPSLENGSRLPPTTASTIALATRTSELGSMLATFFTTLSIFGIFLIQGVIVARILGPLGRGEYGTALYFPRDVFLYAGLLGGIEIVNSYAAGRAIDMRSLKWSAAKLGLFSGLLTAACAAIFSMIVLLIVGKTYLIGYCVLCCLFVPWEHIQLTVSAVDRGNRNYRFYNINRLLYALAFPVLVLIVFGLRLDQLTGLSPLLLMCLLSVGSRMIGILPTLRGMEVRKTFQRWWHKSRVASTPRTEFLSTAIATGNECAVEVPGPWTLLKKGRWYALSMLASEVFERLDIFLIVALASVVESGHYFVAVPAAALLTVLPNALAVFTFNYGADPNRPVSLKLAVGVMSITALLQILAAVAFSLLIPYLILLLYDNEFAAAIPFALWLLPASAIKGYLQAVDGYLKGRNKPMVGVKARLLSIAVMLGFVGLVYSGQITGPQQKLLCIPMAACLGQAISMIIISAAVIQDVWQRQHDGQAPDSPGPTQGVVACP